jgi:hypothetical protein
MYDSMIILVSESHCDFGLWFAWRNGYLLYHSLSPWEFSVGVFPLDLLDYKCLSCVRLA